MNESKLKEKATMAVLGVVVLYAAWSVLFHPEAYQYFRVAAKPLVKKTKRKKNKGKKN